MPQPINVLIVEDDPNDAELFVRELRRGGFEPTWRRVETEEEFRAHLRDGIDLVLSDYRLPHFDGLRALKVLQDEALDIPFILISGTIGEEAGVEALRHGVTDYLLKDRLVRLGPAVTHALAETRLSRERRQAEDALRLFRSLIDRSSDTLQIIDPATARILDVNGHGPAELGCTREEYLALRLYDIDSTLSAAGWPGVAARIRDAGAWSGEGFHRRKDGTTFPIEFSAKWVHLDRDYIVTVVRDVSVRQQAEQALRASEERFRQLAENIREVFWITDPAKRHMVYISSAYERIWGRTCASLYAVPGTWLDAIHPDDRVRIAEAVRSKQLAGTYDEEYRIIRPDGSERWIRDQAFPVLDAGGVPQRLVGVAEDITESKKLQEQFLRAQRMEAIGTLAGGVAHDLNNILAPVLLAAALLKDSIRLEHERQLLDLVEQAAQRGANIVRQLLTFSRGTGGERVSVQLRHLLAEMTDLARETFPRNITTKSHVTADLQPVAGDPTQLHQVLMNLCLNARDAMPDGGTLSLTARNVELGEAEVKPHRPAQPGSYVALSITDTGQGIAPEILERIFDPFFTTKPATKGTGLGLSTVLGIVRSHHGIVTVASTPGQGTTFVVQLPVASVSADMALPPNPDRLPMGHGELILLVDDEAAILTALRLSLEQHGYRVLTAGNGTEGLAAYLEHRDEIRVVLTDVMMPVMGGIGLIRALRAADPRVKVIATSGLNDQMNHSQLRAVGINHMLPKPCLTRELLEAIHAQLSS